MQSCGGFLYTKTGIEGMKKTRQNESSSLYQPNQLTETTGTQRIEVNHGFVFVF